MATWKLIHEVKENGYYIGWHREHPEIHEVRKPTDVMGKHSLVQIGGQPGLYEVLGQTVAHSVFAKPGVKGRILYKKIFHVRTLTEARKIATSLKSELAKKFDKLTRG